MKLNEISHVRKRCCVDYVKQVFFCRLWMWDRGPHPLPSHLVPSSICIANGMFLRKRRTGCRRRTHTHSISLSNECTHTHTHCFSIAHTQTHTYCLSIIHTHTHNYFYICITITHTHSLSLSNSLTQTLPLSFILYHTHILSPSLSLQREVRL
jgi:hypothetical protein